MNLLKLIFVLILLILVSCSKSRNLSSTVYKTEPDTLFVSKEKSTCENGYYELLIYSEKSKSQERSCNPFSYDFVFNAPVNLRIKVIKQLLAFRNDSSATSSYVKCYYKKKLDLFGNEFRDQRLTTQIMALYHINLIAFGQFSVFKFSPYPVLFDAVEGRVINNDQIKIQEVYRIYSKWFDENLRYGFSNFKFPLSGTRYRWIHADADSRFTMKEFPVIRNEYKYRIGVPVD